MPRNDGMMPFSDHLEELRRMLLRVIAVSGIFMLLIFWQKKLVWQLLLAPSKDDFCTYEGITKVLHAAGMTDFHFERLNTSFIATELSAQFMTHLSTSLYLGLLMASPYIVLQLFGFIAPALKENEQRYSVRMTVTIYGLFLLGMLTSYFILFPISFRFLSTYSVSDQVVTTVTINSYVDTFVTLTLVMGAAFQLPVVTWLLSRYGLVSAQMMSHYRRHAFILIMVAAAIITPPDILTLLLVGMPLYLLYEVSIKVIR